MQNNRFMNTAAATSSQIDVGLRAYMLGVYNHMTTALLPIDFLPTPQKCWRQRLALTVKCI